MQCLILEKVLKVTHDLNCGGRLALIAGSMLHLYSCFGIIPTTSLSPAVRSQVCKYQWLNNNFPPSCHLYQNFLFNNISNEVYSHTLFLCGTKWSEYICIDGVLCCACIHCFDFLVEQRMSFTLETPNVKFQDISITKLIVWCLSMVLGTWN